MLVFLLLVIIWLIYSLHIILINILILSFNSYMRDFFNHFFSPKCFCDVFLPRKGFCSGIHSNTFSEFSHTNCVNDKDSTTWIILNSWGTFTGYILRYLFVYIKNIFFLKIIMYLIWVFMGFFSAYKLISESACML